MGSTIIALMLVTSQGATEVAQFDTMNACVDAKAQLTNSETFCYVRKPVDVDQAFQHMDKILSKMQESLERVKERQNSPQ